MMMGSGIGLAWSVAALNTLRSAQAAHHEATLPKVDEASDPTARALSYKHDATTVDPAKRSDANAICASCQLFAAGENGWGKCTLFPGKLVNANGWCAGWVKKAG
ncbi:MAG: High potential iron-sulfur protein [Gammaproteobacteria bacterium]|nr:high-potential iron-sulfur protein [Gammaproteobacteria bacterium]NNM00459.1 High potential iron-sulfur protein [Gammaproteobacteria bacterium]